ncbi:MAG: TRAP transporter substrate-binding protein DctP [Mailhella sp.]|nr:TRAP transporter substrate-binding protein DctP [Mailhella sp.]
MKNMMVKSLAFAAALAFCFPVASNAEAQFEWKASSSQVATHPVLQKGFFPLLDRLEKESGGKIHVTYYNPNTLMPQKTHYEALGKGLIDIANFGPSTEHTRFKATSALELPMMFTSAMAGTMTSWDMATGNDAFKKEWAAVKICTITTSVPMDIVSTKPVRTLEDLKGLRIGCSSPSSIEQLKLLGASPIHMNMTDFYLSLQRGMVDAIIGPIPTYKSTKVCEVGKYIIKLSLSVSSSPFGISLKSYAKLPDDLKKVVDDVFDKRASFFRASWIDRSAVEDLEYLKANNGVEVIELSPEEKARWEKTLEPVYAAYVEKMTKSKVDGQAIIDQVRELGKKYADPAVIQEMLKEYQASYGPEMVFGM